jgi:hypothetical protein
MLFLQQLACAVAALGPQTLQLQLQQQQAEVTPGAAVPPQMQQQAMVLEDKASRHVLTRSSSWHS